MNAYQSSLRAQRGISLSGLVGVLALLVVVGMFAMRVFPTYSEYSAAKNAIAAAKDAESPAEIRMAFGRAAQINDIRSLGSSDLTIERVGGKNEVSFDYDKEIPLFKNVRLVIRYAATTAADGVVPERDDEEAKKK